MADPESPSVPAGGTLVLVVGPSGAGKDTLIGEAKVRLASDNRFVFPRRIVTRAASRWEDHDTLDEAQFAIDLAAGSFVVHWRAHGLSYALPATIDGDLSAGRIAICNVSRSVIHSLRARYRRVRVVLIEARPEVLVDRLVKRGREQNLATRAPAARPDLDPGLADDRIDNSGVVAPAAEAFVALLVGYAGG